MNICSGDFSAHEEICYEGRKCPLCLELDNVRQLESKIIELESEVEELKSNQK